ncbi:unnamed protein product [Prunus armeniaca]
MATSLEPCAKYGQPHMGVKSAQELRRMNKSQAFHKETIPMHVFVSWSSWEQLREVCFTNQREGRNCTL